ncbi:MAG: hypothetical protein II874_00210 [Bacteroidales bacterium]|nr:hypothetical protein [Bacteroidales bacterium]
MKGIHKLSTGKKFLMSLLATTVSIILTFGTTAIIDRKKQQAEKREMVLMVMYDMRESLKECEQCQKDMGTFCDLQVDVVAHPEKFSASGTALLVNAPILNYTTTTENIFKTNIETISTIGNILFVEAVSDFYGFRDRYKNDVADEFLRVGETSLRSYEGLSEFDAPLYAYRGGMYYQIMERDFEECMALMKVSEEDLDVFSKERKRVEESILGESMGEMTGKIIEERHQRNAALQKAREEGRKALGQD